MKHNLWIEEILAKRKIREELQCNNYLRRTLYGNNAKRKVYEEIFEEKKFEENGSQ